MRAGRLTIYIGRLRPRFPAEFVPLMTNVRVPAAKRPSGRSPVRWPGNRQAERRIPSATGRPSAPGTGLDPCLTRLRRLAMPIWTGSTLPWSSLPCTVETRATRIGYAATNVQVVSASIAAGDKSTGFVSGRPPGAAGITGAICSAALGPMITYA